MDDGGASSSANEVFNRRNRLAELRLRLSQKYQQFEDRIVPFKAGRWGALGTMVFLYCLRVFVFVGGFYIVTYTMGIHLLYCVVVLITPLNDPDGNNQDDGLDGVTLSSGAGSGSGGSERSHSAAAGPAEHKPFIPKVQEFKVWRSMMNAVLIGFVCTFFSFFDLPVFWPILLLYFVALFVAQMGGRIKHMMQHKYVPFTTNKPKFVAKDDK